MINENGFFVINFSCVYVPGPPMVCGAACPGAKTGRDSSSLSRQGAYALDTLHASRFSASVNVPPLHCGHLPLGCRRSRTRKIAKRSISVRLLGA